MNKLSEKIKKNLKGQKPKPKWQFRALEITKDVLVVLLWLVCVVGLGMLIYMLQNFSPWEKFPTSLYYFWQGFIGLPWEIMILLFLLFVVTYYMFKKVHFVYRLNRWAIVIIVVLSLANGYFIAESLGLNEKIANFSPIYKIYENQGKLISVQRGTVTIGVINHIKENYLEIIDKNNQRWNVIIKKGTIVQTNSIIRAGDIVAINGIKEKDNIKANYIRKIGKMMRGFNK